MSCRKEGQVECKSPDLHKTKVLTKANSVLTIIKPKDQTTTS